MKRKVGRLSSICHVLNKIIPVLPLSHLPSYLPFSPCPLTESVSVGGGVQRGLVQGAPGVGGRSVAEQQADHGRVAQQDGTVQRTEPGRVQLVDRTAVRNQQLH